VVGVVSDTHGLLRPEAVRALEGADVIVHAGDVGRPDVLEDLRTVAPVVAVRGNVDTGAWARDLPVWETVEVGGHVLYVLHDLTDLDLDPAGAGFSAVVSGHTHRPYAETRGGVLYLNPGSIGPRRFTLPVSMAEIRIEDDTLRHRLIDLAV
jgi:putative phosphoesterase